MALPSQIDAAVRTHRRPIGQQAFDRFVIVQPDSDDSDEERADAAQFVKRLGNRHACTGTSCMHPRHTEDVAATNQALILAGLAPDPVPSQDANRRISRDVTPLPGASRAKKRREAEAKNPPAPLPDLTWQLGASCRGKDPDLFHAPDGERAQERIVREAKAKAVCMGCPVASACLEYALEKREQGVWGGTSDEERTSLRRRRTWREKAA